MSFKKSDQDAYAADKPLSTAALTRSLRNYEDIVGTITPAGGCSYDIRRAPFVCGDASEGTTDLSGECGLAYLIYPEFANPLNDKTYTVTVRASNPSDYSLFFRASYISISDWLAGRYSTVGENYELVSTATETFDLTAPLGSTIDPIALTNTTDPYVLVINIRSEMGPYELLYDPKMTGDETGLLTLNAAGNNIIAEPAALWNGTDAQADTQLPYRFLFGRADTSGTYDPGAYDPDVWFTGEIQPPQWQHLMRGTGFVYHTYPGIPPTTSVVQPTDALARQAMAYGYLYAVHIAENNANVATLSINGVSHGQAASAYTVQNISNQGENKIIYGDSILAIEADVAEFNDPPSSLPASRRQKMARIGWASYLTFCEWVVGGPRLTYRANADSSTSTRNTYTVTALATWCAYNNASPPAGAISMRAVIEDSGGDIIGETQIYDLTATAVLTLRSGQVITSNLSYKQGAVLGFQIFGDYTGRTDHSLRDLYPLSMAQATGSTERGINAFVIKLSVQDAGHTTQTACRRIRLESKFTVESGASTPPNANNPGQHSLHLWGCHVGLLQSNNPSLIGDY